MMPVSASGALRKGGKHLLYLVIGGILLFALWNKVQSDIAADHARSAISSSSESRSCEAPGCSNAATWAVTIGGGPTRYYCDRHAPAAPTMTMLWAIVGLAGVYFAFGGFFPLLGDFFDLCRALRSRSL